MKDCKCETVKLYDGRHRCMKCYKEFVKLGPGLIDMFWEAAAEAQKQLEPINGRHLYSCTHQQRLVSEPLGIEDNAAKEFDWNPLNHKDYSPPGRIR